MDKLKKTFKCVRLFNFPGKALTEELLFFSTFAMKGLKQGNVVIFQVPKCKVHAIITGAQIFTSLHPIFGKAHFLKTFRESPYILLSFFPLLPRSSNAHVEQNLWNILPQEVSQKSLQKVKNEKSS